MELNWTKHVGKTMEMRNSYKVGRNDLMGEDVGLGLDDR